MDGNHEAGARCRKEGRALKPYDMGPRSARDLSSRDSRAQAAHELFRWRLSAGNSDPRYQGRVTPQPYLIGHYGPRCPGARGDVYQSQESPVRAVRAAGAGAVGTQRRGGQGERTSCSPAIQPDRREAPCGIPRKNRQTSRNYRDGLLKGGVPSTRLTAGSRGPVGFLVWAC